MLILVNQVLYPRISAIVARPRLMISFIINLKLLRFPGKLIALCVHFHCIKILGNRSVVKVKLGIKSIECFSKFNLLFLIIAQLF